MNGADPSRAPDDATAPDLAAVVRARARIRDLVAAARFVPTDPWAGREAPDGAGGPDAPRFVLVDDTVQATGAFKLRGAAAAVTALDPERRAAGVVAVSTGNHGRAVAHAARRSGTVATVFVSERVPEGKRTALRDAGADLRVIGADQDEAEAHARKHADATGAAWIPPFDHPDVIAGQGTLGLELLDAVPDLDTVIVPLSGGGLIAGVAMAIRSVRPAVRVIGVSPVGGAAMIGALRAGRIVPVPEKDTLADSLQGGLGSDNRYTLRMVRAWVHATAQVEEADLADAMRFAFEHHRLVLEGAGAAAIAAVRSGALRRARPVAATTGPDAEPAPAERPRTGVTALLATGSAVEARTYAHVLSGGSASPSP